MTVQCSNPTCTNPTYMWSEGVNKYPCRYCYTCWSKKQPERPEVKQKRLQHKRLMEAHNNKPVYALIIKDDEGAWEAMFAALAEVNPKVPLDDVDKALAEFSKHCKRALMKYKDTVTNPEDFT